MRVRQVESSSSHNEVLRSEPSNQKAKRVKVHSKDDTTSLRLMSLGIDNVKKLRRW